MLSRRLSGKNGHIFFHIKIKFFTKWQSLIGLFLALLISTTLIIQSTAGAASASDGGQAPAESELALPKVFGKPSSVRVGPAIGAVTDQILLVVPPGRRNIEPQLTLTYSSMAGLGTLGLGWFLETGYVEVWRGDGTPTVGEPDSFTYSLSGAGGQLVNTGNGVYRAKLESIYREFRRNQGHGGWEMYNGEGALHRFGGTPNSRIPGQQWMLDYVEDPNGNTITYTYERVGDVLYISEIKYTGYAPSGDLGANLVEFEYESRDDVRLGYGFSQLQEKNLRLKRISMYASGQLARRYEFIYENNPLNSMSMLKQVILVGADDISRITLRELEYGSRSLGWTAQPTALDPFSDPDGLDTGRRLVDVNGDGFADLIGNGTHIRLGSGDNFVEYTPDWKTWSDSLRDANVKFAVDSGDYEGADTGVRLLDVNSDGLPDLFIAQPNRRQIYLNTGSGWSYTQEVCSGDICTTGESWTTGIYGLDSIGSQSVYENTIYVVPPGVYDDTYSEWTYNGSWLSSSSVPDAYEHTLHTSDTVGNSASITFHGTQFILRYTGDTDRGEVEISVDEAYLDTLDQQSNTQAWQLAYSSPVLEDGIHTIVFEHLSGSIIDIDAIEFLVEDEIPPAAIDDLAAAPGTVNGAIDLNWTSTGDDGDSGIPTQYLVRYSSSEILTESEWDTATPVESNVPAPGIAGTSKSMTVGDLTPGETYYFAIRALDEADNLGALSNSPWAEATSGLPSSGWDEVPPAAITDLSATPGAEGGSVELTWTAPGDDDDIGTATTYRVRYSTQEILTEADWETAVPVGEGIPIPGIAGTLESMTISNLLPGEIYYFAVRAYDEQGNLGGLSNSTSAAATTPPLTGSGGDEGMHFVRFVKKSDKQLNIDALEVLSAPPVDASTGSSLVLAGFTPAVTPNHFSAQNESPNNNNAACQPFALASDHGDSKGVQLTDVNADGRVDIVWSYRMFDFPFPDWFSIGCLTDVRGVFLNTGTGWELDLTLTEALAAVDFFVVDTQLMGYDLLDVNADGMADIVRTLGGQPREVRLGTGSSWEYNAAFSASLEANGITSLSDDRKGQGLMPMDFNDDGLVDYLRANGTDTRAYANTGTGWVEAPEMSSVLIDNGIAFNTSDGKGTGIVSADINGDGLVDFARSKPGDGYWEIIYLSEGTGSGLLTRSTSALGEVTAITWASSTQFDNTRENGVQGLPGPMSVVTTLARDDGRGNAHLTSYTYTGGWYTDRQFRGFFQSEEILPSGLSIVSHYHQEEGLVGLIEVEEESDVQGEVRFRRTAEYNIIDTGLGVTQFSLAQIDTENIDPGGTTHSRIVNEFDGHLNYISVQRDPEVSIQNDESTTYFTWAHNDAKGIWGYLERTQTLNSGGSIVLESITLYDGLPEGQVEKGLPSEIRELVEPGKYVTNSIAYDEFGNIVQVLDREGNPSIFGYDETTSTFRIRAIDPEGGVVHSEYDPRFGTLTKDIDAGGNATLKEYDAFGRLIKITLPGDESSPFGTQSVSYSVSGDATAQHYIISETEYPGEPNTLDTTYYYDGMGLIYKAERETASGRNVVTLTEYDDAGNATAQSRPFFEGDAPQWSIISRDELHRPTLVTEPLGTQVSMTYAGPRVDITDARGIKTSYYRDADGNTTAIHQWVNGVEQVTSYQYDVLGQLVGITDALGEQTTITYDLLGRRTRLEDPNTGTYQYRYDNEGRLIEQVSPDGQTTTFTYDLSGNLLTKHFPDGSVHEFTYDLTGKLVQVQDAAGVMKIEYDSRGRAISRQRTVSGKAYETRYAYDSLDRVNQITYPDKFTVNYVYDSGGNLVEITDRSGRVLAHEMVYNAAGQLMGIQYGNGVQSNFTYDELLRMTAIHTLTGEQEPLQNLEYAYDPNGNILSITDTAFNASQSFEYDTLGRLTKAIGAYGEEIYEYDPIGNLTRKGSMFYGFDSAHPQHVVCGIDMTLVRGNANGIENNPHANPCQNLPGMAEENLSEKRNRIGGPENNPNIASSFQVIYDANGNAVQKGGMQYEYDFENHMIRVRDGKGKLLIENTYDAAGQRVLQRSQSGTTVYIDGIYEESNSHTSRHVQAGPLLIATIVLPRSAADAGQSPPPNSFNALAGMAGFMFTLVWMPFQQNGRRKWLYGLNALKDGFRAHPNRLLVLLFILIAIVTSAAAPEFNGQASQALRGAEKRYYYHANHLGSINVVTDDQGKVVERREYKPYGDPFEWTGPKSGPREFLQTFNGQYYDDTIGMYYFGARHYDPQLGRFLASDTQVPDPTDPRTLNRYALAGGNPLRYIDPTGHAWYDFLIAAFVIIVAIVLTVVSCGALAGVGVALIAIGAGLIAASVALACGFSPSSVEFWQMVIAGVVIGAVVGAGIAALPLLAAESGATFMEAVIAGALVGAATGAIEETIVHFASGGSPEDLLGENLWKSIGFGAALGAVAGGVSSKFMASSAKWVQSLGKLLAPGMKYILFGKSAYGAIFSGITGHRHKIFTEFLWDPFWYGVHGDINEYVDELDNTFRPRAQVYLFLFLLTMPLAP